MTVKLPYRYVPATSMHGGKPPPHGTHYLHSGQGRLAGIHSRWLFPRIAGITVLSYFQDETIIWMIPMDCSITVPDGDSSSVHES